jgi:DNA-damage-inducible protein D
MESNLIPFEGKSIRKVWHNNEWHFAIIDVIEALTGSISPKTYWDKLKSRDFQPPPFWGSLKVVAKDGKKRATDCANTEGMFRIIMSVPSSKAEPFKMWLAQVGKERIEETENPELAFERARAVYKAKGYPEDWIGYREKSTRIRKELTAEWQKRGIKEGVEYSILTAEISKATFGVTPKEHNQLKGLEKQNLRDHMTNFELLFSALGEEAARSITVDKDAQGFEENQIAAQKGGTMAGNARRNFEKELGKPVVSTTNFLGLKGEVKRYPSVFFNKKAFAHFAKAFLDLKTY